MEIEYTLTMKDLGALTRPSDEKRPKRSPIPGQVIWFVILILLACWALLHPEYAAAGVLPYVGYFLAGIFVSAGGWVVLWLWSKKATFVANERFQADERNRWIFEPRRMRLRPEGMTITSRVQQLNIAWSGIHQIDTLGELVVFWTTTTSGQFVPRRAFRDQQHFDEFVALARQYQQGLKPTGIIAGLPPESSAITPPDAP